MRLRTMNKEQFGEISFEQFQIIIIIESAE